MTPERSAAHASHVDATESSVPRRETTCLFIPKACRTGGVFSPCSGGRQWGGERACRLASRWEWSQSHLALGHADAQSKFDSEKTLSARGPSPWASNGGLIAPSVPPPPACLPCWASSYPNPTPAPLNPTQAPQNFTTALPNPTPPPLNCTPLLSSRTQPSPNPMPV